MNLAGRMPVTKDHMCYDYIYVTFQNRQSYRDWKSSHVYVELGLRVGGCKGNWGWQLRGAGLLWGYEKCSKIRLLWWPHKVVNILNLLNCTLSGWVSQHNNYISIKLFKRKASPQALEKQNINSLYDPAIAFVIHTKETKAYIHTWTWTQINSIIHDNQKVKKPECPSPSKQTKPSSSSQ